MYYFWKVNIFLVHLFVHSSGENKPLQANTELSIGMCLSSYPTHDLLPYRLVLMLQSVVVNEKAELQDQSTKKVYNS